jgi:hypothetical protein
LAARGPIRHRPPRNRVRVSCARYVLRFAQRDAVPSAEPEVVSVPVSAGLSVPVDAASPLPPEVAAFVLAPADAGSLWIPADAGLRLARGRAADSVLWFPHAVSAALLLSPLLPADGEASHPGSEPLQLPAASIRACLNRSLSGCGACRR